MWPICPQGLEVYSGKIRLFNFRHFIFKIILFLLLIDDGINHNCQNRAHPNQISEKAFRLNFKEYSINADSEYFLLSLYLTF